MNLIRLYIILRTLKSYQIDKILPKSILSKKILWLFKLLFWVRLKNKDASDGIRLKLCLQELGPIWVKFGQMLSTRRDLLPEVISDALSELQDKVKPFDGKIAKSVIEESLKQPLESIFKDFNIEPLASASIAQVHTATLINGNIPIVIKVLRPNIQQSIQKDINLMFWLAQKAEKWNTNLKRYHLNDIVNDYKTTIFDELNLLKEAHNTQKLRHNFLNSNMLYVPFVYPELSSQTVLVEERVFGTPISDIEKLKEHNVNLKLLSERGVTIFFKQVFEDNFFHADMHPGNIFIETSNPIDPYYIGIDCAIIGTLSEKDQYFLADIFMAFFNQDYQKIAMLYIKSEWVNPSTNLSSLEMSIKEVCEPIFNKPLEEISFAQVLIQLFTVAQQYEIQIQPQLILLQKTLFYIEGLGRQLYPQLDLWQTAKPFLENWSKKQRNIKNISHQVIQNLPEWKRMMFGLPDYLSEIKKENRQLSLKMDELKKENSKLHARFKVANLINGLVALGVLYFIFFQ